MIRELWDKFIENSAASYQPRRHLTFDEQLLPTKARCQSTKFMPKILET